MASKSPDLPVVEHQKEPGGVAVATSDKNEESVDPEQKEFEKRFKLMEALGSGSFGEVFNGYDRRSKTFVAIKVERTMPAKRGSLEKERVRYDLLKERLDAGKLAGLPELAIFGIPKVFGFFKTSKKSFLVMEKMGPSLETLFQQCKRKFSLKTVCQIAIQMLDRVQTIHTARMIHRDIKPDNFVIGCQEDPAVGRNFIRIIDFGLSRDYVQPNGRHIAETQGRELVGTVRYVSIRVHDGVEQSRRDDIEAIGHVLIYFLKPLPWMGINAPDNLPDRQKAKIRYKLVGEKKKEMGIDGLTTGLPPQFKRYLQYARNEMDFDEKPDYNFLRSLFLKLMTKENFPDDDLYDWDELEGAAQEEVPDISSTNKAARGTPQT